MKRIALLVGLFLVGGAGSALADQSGPGPGRGRAPQLAAPERAARGQAQPRARMQRQRLKARLVQRFDRDGDGRLTGRERRAAKRFVLRLRHQQQRMRMERQGGGATR